MRSKYWLLFSVLNHSELNIVEFWTVVGQNKQSEVVTLETEMGIFHHLPRFYR